MTEDYRVSYSAYLKYLTAATLMIAWVLAAWTGFMLGVVPYAPGAEKETLMLGFTRAEWGVIHSWLSVIAVGITAVEVIMSRKSVGEFARYLTEPQGREAAD